MSDHAAGYLAVHLPLEQKIEKIVADFNSQADWEKKYEKLIEYGKKWPGLSDEFKVDDLKVKGCQSQVWIKAELKPDGRISLRGDSDALIVKGLIALVLMIYDNETPETLLKHDAQFLKTLGLDSGLSPSRSNGLYSMIKQIKYYATAYQFLLTQQKK